MTLGPYREPADVKRQNVPWWRRALVARLAIIVWLGLAFWLGWFLAPEIVEVEVEVDHEGPPTWRERGCLSLCGSPEKVIAFASADFAYICQCEGSPPLPAEAFKELW